MKGFRVAVATLAAVVAVGSWGLVGAGQQQVRFIGANIGASPVCLWSYTMTEAWAWGRKDEELVDRSASPWDSPTRRPSWHRPRT